MSSSGGQYDESRLSHFDAASKDVDIENCFSDEPSSLVELEQLSDVQEYDPQIRQHLEELNRFATKINQLEKCFEEENSKFQKVLNESSVQLNKLTKKCGEKNVNEARPYYDAMHRLKSLQIKCQVAAIKFEKYNEIHIQAKQAISDTELMFHKEMREDDKRDDFDQFWQEKLNTANLKFMEAKAKRKQYEDEHMSVMLEFRALENKMSTLIKKSKNSIKRAKLYFDEANIFDSKLKCIKDDIKKLEEELSESKRQYSQALKNLENISEEIHEKRAQILARSLKREPGVGAELTATCDTDGELRESICRTMAHLGLAAEDVPKSLESGLSVTSELDIDKRVQKNQVS